MISADSHLLLTPNLALSNVFPQGHQDTPALSLTFTWVTFTLLACSQEALPRPRWWGSFACHGSQCKSPLLSMALTFPLSSSDCGLQSQGFWVSLLYSGCRTVPGVWQMSQRTHLHLHLDPIVVQDGRTLPPRVPCLQALASLLPLFNSSFPPTQQKCLFRQCSHLNPAAICNVLVDLNPM